MSEVKIDISDLQVYTDESPALDKPMVVSVKKPVPKTNERVRTVALSPAAPQIAQQPQIMFMQQQPQVSGAQRIGDSLRSMQNSVASIQNTMAGEQKRFRQNMQESRESMIKAFSGFKGKSRI